MKNIYITALLLSTVAFTSCKKDNENSGPDSPKLDYHIQCEECIAVLVVDEDKKEFTVKGSRTITDHTSNETVQVEIKGRQDVHLSLSVDDQLVFSASRQLGFSPNRAFFVINTKVR